MRKAGTFIHDRAGEVPRPIAPKGAAPASRPARLPEPEVPTEDTSAKGRPAKKKEA